MRRAGCFALFLMFLLTGPAMTPARAGPSVAVPPGGDAAKAQSKDSENAVTATVTPVATPPAVPSERDGKTDRGLAIYNGRWTINASGSCPHPSRGYLTINDGVIRGSTFGGDGSGRIFADGSVSGHFQFVGIFQGRVTGRMTSSTSGRGSWRNNVGCTGGWTMSKS